MDWGNWESDPTVDCAAAEVLAAYEAARQAHLPLAVCFRVGVAAWRRVHPDQSADYAARQAVTVILEAKATGTSPSAQHDAAA
jgi:hypothetical protein